MSNLQPFQQRVVDEKTELDVKLTALRSFFESPTFSTVPEEEKNRLCKQANAMADYSEILGERITAFQ